MEYSIYSTFVCNCTEYQGMNWKMLWVRVKTVSPLPDPGRKVADNGWMVECTGGCGSLLNSYLAQKHKQLDIRLGFTVNDSIIFLS